jgi:malate dehydrogenase (oxaloacetate-decarboxylating)(NADP+)
VALAGLIRALHLNNATINDARVVFFGAGSAAVGIAEMMRDYAVLEAGMTKEDAAKLFWLVDSKGLVSEHRGDKLAPHKLSLARRETDLPKLTTLEEVIDFVRPTALLGLSTVGGTFTPSILRKMASFNKSPIIFPLSNPTTKSECTFSEALEHTDGRVLFASGSPFLPVQYNGVEVSSQQANNMSIFPGLGKACVMAEVTRIPDELIHASAQALAESLNPAELAEDKLFPELTRIREISVVVARQVIRAAQKCGVDGNTSLRKLSDEGAFCSGIFVPC